jgi:hypothetical protein
MPDQENETVLGDLFGRLRIFIRNFGWFPRISLLGFLGIVLFLAAMSWVIFLILTR